MFVHPVSSTERGGRSRVSLLLFCVFGGVPCLPLRVTRLFFQGWCYFCFIYIVGGRGVATSPCEAFATIRHRETAVYFMVCAVLSAQHLVADAEFVLMFYIETLF